MNVSVVESAPEWVYLNPELMDDGYAYVAVSAQAKGVEGGTPLLGLSASLGLVEDEPARYQDRAIARGSSVGRTGRGCSPPPGRCASGRKGGVGGSEDRPPRGPERAEPRSGPGRETARNGGAAASPFRADRPL